MAIERPAKPVMHGQQPYPMKPVLDTSGQIVRDSYGNPVLQRDWRSAPQEANMQQAPAQAAPQQARAQQPMTSPQPAMRPSPEDMPIDVMENMTSNNGGSNDGFVDDGSGTLSEDAAAAASAAMTMAALTAAAQSRNRRVASDARRQLAQMQPGLDGEILDPEVQSQSQLSGRNNARIGQQDNSVVDTNIPDTSNQVGGPPNRPALTYTPGTGNTGNAPDGIEAIDGDLNNGPSGSSNNGNAPATPPPPASADDAPISTDDIMSDVDNGRMSKTNLTPVQGAPEGLPPDHTGTVYSTIDRDGRSMLTFIKDSTGNWFQVGQPAPVTNAGMKQNADAVVSALRALR